MAEVKSTSVFEQPGAKADVVLLIPALNPDRHLLQLLQELQTCWHGPVLLVDDGSDRAARETVFPAAVAMGCRLVTHVVNLGKGRALKTGFNAALQLWPDLTGVVTADADGQHLPVDICAVADALRAHSDSLVLGCRDFNTPDVPRPNRFGNKTTCQVMRFMCGVSVSDTQTGLRGISADFMRTLMRVDGEGFAFETQMLLETRTRSVPIFEVPIATVYQKQDRVSHFNPLTDSLRIYALFFKFCTASLAGSLVDLVLFAILCALLGTAGWAITASTVLARACSALVNFLLNRHVVFRAGDTAHSAVRYAILCVLQAAASAALVTGLHLLAPGVPAVLVKVIVDVALFFISFQVQRRWIFVPERKVSK